MKHERRVFVRCFVAMPKYRRFLWVTGSCLRSHPSLMLEHIERVIKGLGSMAMGMWSLFVGLVFTPISILFFPVSVVIKYQDIVTRLEKERRIEVEAKSKEVQP